MAAASPGAHCSSVAPSGPRAGGESAEVSEESEESAVCSAEVLTE